MISVREVRLYSHRFPLRRPFRFGIVELNALEHLVVAATFLIHGEPLVGYAGENLVPRWFVKDPTQTVDDELAIMRRAIRLVGDAAIRGGDASTPFDLWWRLHQHVRSEALVTPPLLAQLGESLIERAAIDAWGRFHQATFNDLLRDDRLGIDLGRVHPGLHAAVYAPATHLFVRHTVGLADDPKELPELLAATGVHRLKIKLAGDAVADADRIHHVCAACEGAAWEIDRITLDGNENYSDIGEYERLLRALRSRSSEAVTRKIRWIEQPFRRDIALSDAAGAVIAEAPSPPMVIDESDASPADLPRALSLGYAGTTHKNCKGVFNSIIHRAVLDQHAAATGRAIVFSGEDLTIVAPWSQASDLTVAATVGVCDIERNGHHFADGLSGFGGAISEAAMLDYPELYRPSDDGVVGLRIVDGRVAVPKGTAAPPLLDQFVELAD